jgi:hypothetical protein
MQAIAVTSRRNLPVSMDVPIECVSDDARIYEWILIAFVIQALVTRETSPRK